MTKQIEVVEQNTRLLFEVTDEKKVYLLYCGTGDIPQEIMTWTNDFKASFTCVEVQMTGENFNHKGVKFFHSTPGNRLVYVRHEVTTNSDGKQLCVTQRDEKTNLIIHSFYQLYKNIPIIRSWTTLVNEGSEDLGIEYVSSFALTGMNQINDYKGNYAEHNIFYKPHNNWTAELQWQVDSLKNFGLDYWVDGEKKQASTKRVSVTNNSSWSCSEYSPNGILTNSQTNVTSIWQLETNGAWHYELSDTGSGDLLGIRLSGPEEMDNSWWKQLKPGGEFTTIPVAFGQMTGDFETAIQAMTDYRRHIRRPNRDNETLPVIFNDYMNCLMGDPTTEKEIPLIDAAKKAGCEYFVVDCGWYADGFWWDSVGEWKPSKKRFPNGMAEVIQYIRSKEMIPGLWLELEVMGINCPIASELPDSWFFTRHGKRIIDASRYHLDFRNKEVRDFADRVIDRLVSEYGVGYIKMDYNITTGIGTEEQADSMGDGLLEHNRSYLSWLDSIFERYPELIIENCGSGGMRHDYAMLQRHSIQSLTDQTDYIRNGAIAAVGTSAMTPEQCAVWAYPLKNGDDEEVIYNMINAMLLRIHQSGYLNELTESRFELVKEGIKTYKSYREIIKEADPIWPNGLPHIDDEFIVFGLKKDKEIYLAVWNNDGESAERAVNLNRYGEISGCEMIYPQKDDKVTYQFREGQLVLNYSRKRLARLFKIALV